MTTTPNLQIDHIAAAQAQKEVTANAAFDALDRALCQFTSLPIEDTDTTLTASQLTSSFALSFSGSLTQARTLTFPAVSRLLLLENASGFALTLQGQGGGSLNLGNTERKLVYVNGGTLQLVANASAAGAVPYDLGGSFSGAPISGAVILRYPFPRAVRFPANLEGSRATLGIAPEGEAVFSLQKNGLQFATMTFPAGDPVADFTASTSTDFLAGDILTLVAPVQLDASMADLGFALSGIRL